MLRKAETAAPSLYFGGVRFSWTSVFVDSTFLSIVCSLSVRLPTHNGLGTRSLTVRDRHGERVRNIPEQPGTARNSSSSRLRCTRNESRTEMLHLYLLNEFFFSNTGCDRGLVTRFTYECGPAPPAERAEEANAAEVALARAFCSRPKTDGTTTTIFSTAETPQTL